MSTSRGARSRIEFGIEGAAEVVAIAATPHTTIQALSRRTQTTSIVVPLPDVDNRVRQAIAQYGIEMRPWGGSLLVKARPTTIHALLERVGLASRIITIKTQAELLAEGEIL